MKKKPGRPVVPKSLAKGTLLSVRFSGDERAALEAAAAAAGLTLSAWARGALLAASSDSGGDAGHDCL